CPDECQAMFFVLRSFRNVLLAGGTLTIVGATAWAEEKPLFEEPFSGKLSPGWTWIDEVPGSWRLTDDGLELKVLPVGEGLWAAGRKHPNLLLRDPGKSGDFALEVQLTCEPT